MLSRLESKNLFSTGKLTSWQEEETAVIGQVCEYKNIFQNF